MRFGIFLFLLYSLPLKNVLSIVDEPFPIRDLAADCPIFLIFKHFTLSFISYLCCSLKSSKGVPAVHMVLLEPYPFINPSLAEFFVATVLQKTIILSI